METVGEGGTFELARDAAAIRRFADDLASLYGDEETANVFLIANGCDGACKRTDSEENQYPSGCNCPAKRFPAHRDILLARCGDFFRTVLSNRWNTSLSAHEVVVELPHMQSDVLEAILKYAYGISFQVDEERLLDLILAYDYFQMHELKKLALKAHCRRILTDPSTLLLRFDELCKPHVLTAIGPEAPHYLASQLLNLIHDSTVVVQQHWLNLNWDALKILFRQMQRPLWSDSFLLRVALDWAIHSELRADPDLQMQHKTSHILFSSNTANRPSMAAQRPRLSSSKSGTRSLPTYIWTSDALGLFQCDPVMQSDHKLDSFELHCVCMKGIVDWVESDCEIRARICSRLVPLMKFIRWEVLDAQCGVREFFQSTDKHHEFSLKTSKCRNPGSLCCVIWCLLRFGVLNESELMSQSSVLSSKTIYFREYVNRRAWIDAIAFPSYDGFHVKACRVSKLTPDSPFTVHSSWVPMYGMFFRLVFYPFGDSAHTARFFSVFLECDVLREDDEGDDDSESEESCYIHALGLRNVREMSDTSDLDEAFEASFSLASLETSRRIVSGGKHWECKPLSYEIVLLHKSGNPEKHVVRSMKNMKFRHDEKSWGWPGYASRELVLAQNEGYLDTSQDALSFVARIRFD